MLGILAFNYGLNVSLCSAFFALSVLLLTVYLLIDFGHDHFGSRWLCGLAFVFLFFSLGVYVSMAVSRRCESPSSYAELYAVRLLGNPVESKSAVECIGSATPVEINSGKTLNVDPVRAVFYLSKSEETQSLSSGDSLLIAALSAKQQRHTLFQNTELRTKLINEASVLMWVPADHYTVLSRSCSASGLLDYACRVQKYCYDLVRSNVSGDEEAAVVSALVLGKKDLLSADLKHQYASTGASHVLAVSGMHVGVVFMVFSFLFSFFFRGELFKPRLLRSACILLCLWLYAFISGLSPSVVRAVIMFSLMLIGGCFARKGYFYNSLFFAAFLMLLYNPFYLFDVSFQLSFVAVFSIVFFHPYIVSWFNPANRVLSYVWQLVAVSFASQICTLPLMLYYFHQFPVFFWLTSLLVVPLSALVIYFSFAYFALHWVPFLSVVLCYGLNWVTKVMNEIVSLVNTFPSAVLDWVPFSLLDVFLLGMALLMLGSFLVYRRALALNLSVTFFLLLVLATPVLNLLNSDKGTVVVCDCRGSSVVNLYSNSSNVLYKDDFNDSTVVARMKSFWLSESTKKPSMDTTGVLTDGKNTIFVLNKVNYDALRYYPVRPLAVDYLVVSSDVRMPLPMLQGFFSYHHLIIDSSCSRRTAEWWKSVAPDCYAVTLEGPYIESVY